MKRYIFLTANIHPIGGMQNYVAGKAAYLEKNGWKVTVFFWGDNKGTCAMTSIRWNDRTWNAAGRMAKKNQRTGS